MNFLRIWWISLWLWPFFFRFGNSISEFETDPETLCDEDCKPIENGDFKEFWCVYKARSSKDFVYAGICETNNQSDVSKLQISSTVLTMFATDEYFPVRLIPFTEQSAFTSHFAFVTEDKGWFVKNLISETCNYNPFDYHPGGFITGTDFHRSKPLGYDAADVCSFTELRSSSFEKLKYAKCFDQKISCATDMDTLELVTIPGRVQSVYTRSGLFVYLKCSKVICRTMIKDIVANTTYYIPTDLKVSKETLIDYQEFLYLVPRIEKDDSIFDDERRYKHEKIGVYEACDTYLLKPSTSSVWVVRCNIFFIVLIVLGAIGLSLGGSIAAKLFYCCRNRRRLRRAYQKQAPQVIAPAAPTVVHADPRAHDNEKQYESFQGNSTAVSENQPTNLDSVPPLVANGNEKV